MSFKKYIIIIIIIIVYLDTCNGAFVNCFLSYLKCYDDAIDKDQREK